MRGALAIALLVVGCGGGTKAGPPNGDTKPPPDSTGPADTGSASTGTSPRPVSAAECTQLLDHIVALSTSEQRQRVRAEHEAAEKKRADRARAAGKPAPEAKPLDETLLWTDEDAAAMRESFQTEHLKQCLNMPRTTVECALGAKTTAAIREC